MIQPRGFSGRSRRRASAPVLPLLVALLAATGCGPRIPPATRPAPPPASAAAATVTPATLPADLDRIFGSPTLARMQWGVLVQSLDSGAVLYERNAGKLMMPASNMKIVTLAAAAERLGWAYRYETRIETRAPVEDGVVNGDVLVVGTGDPTLSRRGGSPTRVFEEWADRLRAAGIRRIEGRLLADARAFDDETLGAGWAWDDVAYSYSAGVSALQFNEGVAEIRVHPGATGGASASVEVQPVESGLFVDNRVVTIAAGDPDIELRRLPGSSRVVVSGTIPVGATDVGRWVTVDDPALYFVRVLRGTLVAKGIAVSGEAARVEPVAAATATLPARVLLTHQSPPLSEMARVLMKVSQNLYAETFVKTLSAQAGTGGTTQAGHKVVREVMTSWGIAPDSYVLADGSGLSRYNYACAEMLVGILRHLYRDPTHRDPFTATLPVGGEDGGTIARRFKGTRAERNVRAKTGSIANVRALSGYVTTLDGEPIVFSIIANGFTQPQETIDAATDLAVERLANLTRKRP